MCISDSCVSNPYHLRNLGDLCAGDHVCHLYSSEEERSIVLGQFFAQGIERNEKCVFVRGTSTEEESISLLEKGGMGNLRSLLQTGQFEFMYYGDVYYNQEGEFDSQEMIKRLAKFSSDALEEGYSAMRITGEMTWLHYDSDVHEKLMRYESVLNYHFPAHLIGICCYDVSLFSPQVLLQVLSTHPQTIIQTKLFHNIYFMPPDEYLGPNLQEAMLKRWMRNIAERQHVEEQLILAKMEAEKAAQAKASFLAQMSHEIRNPTNGLIGSSDLLARTELSSEQSDLVNIIQSTAHHLYTVVNDVLDFSKIENGSMTLENAPLDVEATIKESIGLCQYTTQKNLAVNVVHNIDSTCPEMILGDAMRLRQILVNLIGNACKFAEKGNIVVSCRRVPTSPSASLPPDKEFNLEFSVSDHGVGISEKDQASLFQKFTQVDVTRKWAGTGLGLAICKQLVEAMNGQIYVKSQLGKGSTFYFCIPVSTPILSIEEERRLQLEQLPPQKDQQHSSKFSRFSLQKQKSSQKLLEELPELYDARVLVVDDNIANQKVLKRMLVKLGCTVDLACNGLEAIEAATNSSYSVIFMDVYMPECDGFTATLRIRENFDKPIELPDWPSIKSDSSSLRQCERPTTCPKIIAFTGTYESRLDGVMDDVLVKPVIFNVLASLLQKFLPKISPSLPPDMTSV